MGPADRSRRPEAAYVHEDADRGVPGWIRGFSELSDPAHYVPREETERVLGELLRRVARPAEATALVAPPGLGKTLLLRLLAERLRNKLQCVYLPYGAIGVRELSAWILGELRRTGKLPKGWDASRSGVVGDPAAELRAVAHTLRAQRSGILLLVDDADGLPSETARALGEWALGSGGALRVVLACCDDSRGSRAIAASRVVHIVRLNERMTERETSLFVRAQLELAGAPATVVERADRDMIARIHRLSMGVPRLVQRIAAWELSDPPSSVHAPWGEEGLQDLALDESDEWPDLSGDLDPELPPDLETPVDRPNRSS